MKKQGFTLMELLIAVSIVAILSVIGVTSYSSISKRSRDAKRKSDLEQVRSALEMYRVDTGSYPSGTVGGFVAFSAENLGLVSTYLPGTPMDPKSTTQVARPYYYSRLGSGPLYYSYCVCGLVENTDVAKNDCGVTPISNCNYYLRNP